MQKLNIKLQEKFQEIVEPQNWIQDWVPTCRYKVFLRFLVDRGPDFPYLKNDLIQARQLWNIFRFIDDLN